MPDGVYSTQVSPPPKFGCESAHANTCGHVVAEVSPRLSEAGWLVYDQYLKANRIEAGAASYGRVVQLVLGVHAGWGGLKAGVIPAAVGAMRQAGASRVTAALS